MLNSIESSLEQYELRCGAAAEACGRSETTIEQLQAALEARELGAISGTCTVRGARQKLNKRAEAAHESFSTDWCC